MFSVAEAQSTFTVLRDIDYAGTGNARQGLDMIVPNSPGSASLPVIVFIHGGGWQGGDRAGVINNLRPLLGNGYIGISIGYRLSGEAVWPAQIHDCKAAIRWIRAHADLAGIAGLPAAYGSGGTTMDVAKIGVWGTSAGGHLVSMLGVSHGVAELEGLIGQNLGQDSAVTCVADYYGPSDLLSMGSFPSTIDHNAENSPESKLLGGPVQENPQAALSASPVNHVTADDSPFLIVHGDKDPSVPYQQSVLLRDLLRNAGVAVDFTKMVGAGHGGFANPELNGRLARFFAKHLAGGLAGTGSGPLPNGPDSDGDLMLDTWETGHGLNPGNVADAGGDKDGDGQSNLAEFLAETDPGDGVDVLRIRNLELSGSDSLITFDSVDERIYRVSGSQDMRVWYLIQRTVLGPDGGGPAVVTASGIHGAAHARRFYRVEVE